jgi:hypothetical protein
MKKPINYDDFKRFFNYEKKAGRTEGQVLAYGLYLLGNTEAQDVNRCIGYIHGAMNISSETAVGRTWDKQIK